jgi:glycosyltransferase involved in cell wall biosynthesis
MLDPWALSHHRMRKRFMWRLWQRSHLARADLLHATSAHESEAIRALGFAQPIAILPNGVQPAPEGPRAGREVLEAAHPRLRGKSWALFLSRLHPKKGVIELLQAWASLPVPVRSSWHLVIAGPIWSRERFTTIAAMQFGRYKPS